MRVIFIKDIGDGGSKTNKFQRDIELEKGIARRTRSSALFILFGKQLPRQSNMQRPSKHTLNGSMQKGWSKKYGSYYSIGNCYLYLENQEKRSYII